MIQISTIDDTLKYRILFKTSNVFEQKSDGPYWIIGKHILKRDNDLIDLQNPIKRMGDLNWIA